VPGFADCYVLVKSRSKQLADEFLAHFLPHHRELADEYEMPQYSDKPEQVFRTAGEALSYLEEHPNQGHALYWENQGCGEARFGMIFPTSDGHMIYGLACQGEDEQIANTILEALKQFFNTDTGYITFEEPPPGTTQEFMDKVESLSNG
jgi:hypothetical protein